MGLHKNLVIQQLDDEIEKSLYNDFRKFCNEFKLSSDENPCAKGHSSSELNYVTKIKNENMLLQQTNNE